MTLRALDLFCGAGGLSLGLQAAGFEVHGVDSDEDAIATHRERVGPCELADLREWHAPHDVDLVAGGPPCQPYSVSGKREGMEVPMGRLYHELIRVAVEANARAVLLENVLGMRSWRDGAGWGVIPRIEADLRAAGFDPVNTILCAADYGVPQNRFRLFIVGFREPEARAAFRWPAPTHAPPDMARMLGCRPHVTVRQALGLRGSFRTQRVDGSHGWQGMRDVHVDEPSRTVTSKTNPDKLSPLDRPACTITTKYDETGDPERPTRRPQVTLGHAVGAVLDRPACTITAGGTGGGGGAEPIGHGAYRDELHEALREAEMLDRPATTIQAAADGRLAPAGHHRRQFPDASTIANGHKPSVRLTAAQCAILQGFPPGFMFVGGIGSQHRQIGNAICPSLAFALGTSIRKALEAT